jgi:hypothetical protein
MINRDKFHGCVTGIMWRNIGMYIFSDKWPEVSRNAEDILKFKGEPLLGLDFEWEIETGEPTILGIGNAKWAVSVTFNQGLPYLQQLLETSPETIYCGHNLIGADLMVLEAHGIKIPLERCEDTILRHWLCNMHLSKTTKKEADPDDHEEKKGRGFNNLWTAASIYTSLRCYKYCRDGIKPGKWKPAKECEGPCPVHEPFWYNGVDCIAPAQMIPPMRRTMQLRGVEKLYPMHKELSNVLAHMQKVGVKIDQPYIADLRDKFNKEKFDLAQSLPFNPESWREALAYFRANGIYLENAQEGTIREACEMFNEDTIIASGSKPHIALFDWMEYKELGDGVDRWYAPRVWNAESKDWEGFVDEFGFLHPSLGLFTSSGRLMCVGPNLQNVAKRRVSRRVCECGHSKMEHLLRTDGHCNCSDCKCEKFVGEKVGKAVRRGIIAPEGYYIVRADYSNAENRGFLYMAGYEPPTTDLHAWMVQNLGLREDEEFSIKMGSARDASKSVTHAADYGEGLKLCYEHELKSKRIKDEIDAGARLVFPHWKFRGRIVTFTGINLANRVWGEATYENRHTALTYVERYIGNGKALPSDFGAWPTGPYSRIRDLQAKIWAQCEQEKMVRPPHGYALLSFGHDEDRMKQAAAVWGSQPIAHFTKLALLKLAPKEWKAAERYPVLQVHDEILTYVRQEIAPESACAWLRDGMVFETPEMPGFKIPVDCSYGSNWRDQTKVKLA